MLRYFVLGPFLVLGPSLVPGPESGRRKSWRTGLTDSFDFDLEFDPSARGLRTDAAAADAPNIFTALQEQLGLKLESTRGPADIYVIDRIERPTD